MIYLFSNSDQSKYMVTFFYLFIAFDMVNSKILIQKLKTLKLPNNALNCVKRDITNRTIVVKYKDAASTERNVSIGIVQGSVLGPLFFFIFINDLPAYMKNTDIIMCADDITVNIDDDSRHDTIEKI